MYWQFILISCCFFTLAPFNQRRNLWKENFEKRMRKTTKESLDLGWDWDLCLHLPGKAFPTEADEVPHCFPFLASMFRE